MQGNRFERTGDACRDDTVPAEFAGDPAAAALSEEVLLDMVCGAGRSSAEGEASMGMDPEACREGAALVASGEDAVLD